MINANIRCRRGVSLLYTAIIIIALFAIISLAVDYGTVQLAKSQLQSTTDAAALAAASGLPLSSTEARSRAKTIGSSNKINGSPLTLLDSDIEFGTWDRNSNTFTVLTGAQEGLANAVRINSQLTDARSTSVKLAFAPVIGFGKKELRSTSIAGFAQSADVVLVQDITNSFSAEINDAKMGDQALLDALYAKGTGQSYFGVVVHTGWGKTLSPLVPIKTSYANLSSVISSIGLAGTTGMPAASGTDISEGLREAVKVFDERDYSSRPNTVRAIVLVSDGEPSQNSKGANPTLNSTQLLNLAKTRADAAWAKGIHVYIVYFNRDGDQTAAAKVATLKRGAGDFVQVTDPKELPTALEKLTRRLPMALLK